MITVAELEGKPVTPKDVLTNNDVHPVALAEFLDVKYGDDWEEWDTETLVDVADEEFKTGISEWNKETVRAMQMLRVSDDPWVRWQTFLFIAQAIEEIAADFMLLHIPTISTLMYTVDVMNSVRKQEFSEEIGRYVASVAKYFDVTYLPSPLDFAQQYLTEQWYTCPACGFKAPVTDKDQKCDLCSGRYFSDHPFSKEPDPEFLKGMPAESKIQLFLYNDPSTVKNRYEHFMRNPPDVEDAEEDPENAQAIRLVAATIYRNVRRKQLGVHRTALGLSHG